jgi:hypothetical protein
MTSDRGGSIQYWAHYQLAWNYYQEHDILSYKQFDAIDWRPIHNTLHDLLRLFQLWASKHVLSIAGTIKFLSYQDDRSPLCPSCHECNKTCKHIAHCPEEGRATAFQESTNAVKIWMETSGTHSDVKFLLLRYLLG